VLSVLIPVYNFNIAPLVVELAQQCAGTGLPWEILCIDDGSSLVFREQNRTLQGRAGIRYEELPDNIGRAAIRNLLAEKAVFPYLLFMDCDSAVVRADYMSNTSLIFSPTPCCMEEGSMPRRRRRMRGTFCIGNLE
jgi:glycosyltransferase involved in cell wall biosynthesis